MTAVEIWPILEDHFQYISLIIIIRIFLDVCNGRILDCKNVIDYTNSYRIAFHKIFSLINENKDSWISKKIINMTLQENLLRHFGKYYSTLVSAIQTMWKEETMDVVNTITQIICYAEISQGNERNTADNVNALIVGAQQEQAPRGTYTN